MPLYLWRSDYLKNYGQGTIVVSAENVQAARELARTGFNRHFPERYSWLYYDGQFLDEDSRQTFEEYRQRFEADIASEPEELPGYVLISGSE